MTASTAQLDSFHRFATAQLQAGMSDVSLEDLLQMWRRNSDWAETIDAIKQGVADVEAGHYFTLDDVDSQIRRRFEQTVTEDSE